MRTAIYGTISGSDLPGPLRGRGLDGLRLSIGLGCRGLLRLRHELLLLRCLALGPSGEGVLLGLGGGGLGRFWRGLSGNRLALGRVPLGGVRELVRGLDLGELALGGEPAELDGEHLLVVGRQGRTVLVPHVLGDCVRARTGPLLER
jgi:hypothetical protein